MQLPDEAITYHFQGLLTPLAEEWTRAAELRGQHFLNPAKIRDLMPRLMQVRSQVAADRELRQVPPENALLDAGFIDLPQKMLDQHRRHGDASLLSSILAQAGKLREQTDHVIILGIGGSYMAAHTLFEALRSPYHNQLPPEKRLGTPRIYFEGNNVDNDAMQELLDLLQTVCVDPDLREALGSDRHQQIGRDVGDGRGSAHFRREAAEYYGRNADILRHLFIPITGSTGKLRELCKADGYQDEDILTMPDDVGGRFSVFTPVGLLPAAVMGLDVQALLLGAATMTRRFLEDPFERNPVLQFAAVNYLAGQQDKPIRILSIWSQKLEALGLWYDQLLAESLGKQGRGPTPITVVNTRDLHSRGQQHQDGARDKLINNLVVKTPTHPPIMIGMADRNQDELNAFNRKGYPDIMAAAHRGTNEAYAEAARPTADLIMPTLSEHTMGQLMQMLMLATVVEGRLMGINPYGQPGVEAYKRNMKALLKS